MERMCYDGPDSASPAKRKSKMLSSLVEIWQIVQCRCYISYIHTYIHIHTCLLFIKEKFKLLDRPIVWSNFDICGILSLVLIDCGNFQFFIENKWEMKYINVCQIHFSLNFHHREFLPFLSLLCPFVWPRLPRCVSCNGPSECLCPHISISWGTLIFRYRMSFTSLLLMRVKDMSMAFFFCFLVWHHSLNFIFIIRAG